MSKPPDVRIRGIRQTIPPGYVLGRKGSADGPVQLLSIRDLANSLTATGTIPANPANLEFLGFFGQGPFSSKQQIQLPTTPRNVTFPSVQSNTVAPNKAWCLNAPTGNFTIVLTNNLSAYLANGSAVICSVLFLAGQTTGAFTYGASTQVLQKAQPYLVMPSSVDASMANVYLQFAGDQK